MLNSHADTGNRTKKKIKNSEFMKCAAILEQKLSRIIRIINRWYLRGIRQWQFLTVNCALYDGIKTIKTSRKRKKTTENKKIVSALRCCFLSMIVSPSIFNIYKPYIRYASCTVPKFFSLLGRLSTEQFAIFSTHL